MTRAELDRLGRICAELPPADAAWLHERLAPPWARRGARQAARAALIRDALRQYDGWRPTRAAMALADDLRRIAACPFAIGDRAELLREIVDLSGGEALAWRRIHDIANSDFATNSE